mmetsp:Transcript_271/g.738  ORF Transcript_271/g.738 Transcript_271/m.738 type:complete len:203 (+) Transcript_271:1935-2543(+)
MVALVLTLLALPTHIRPPAPIPPPPLPPHPEPHRPRWKPLASPSTTSSTTRRDGGQRTTARTTLKASCSSHSTRTTSSTMSRTGTRPTTFHAGNNNSPRGQTLSTTTTKMTRAPLTSWTTLQSQRPAEVVVSSSNQGVVSTCGTGVETIQPTSLNEEVARRWLVGKASARIYTAEPAAAVIVTSRTRPRGRLRFKSKRNGRL